MPISNNTKTEAHRRFWLDISQRGLNAETAFSTSSRLNPFVLPKDYQAALIPSERLFSYGRDYISAFPVLPVEAFHPENKSCAQPSSNVKSHAIGNPLKATPKWLQKSVKFTTYFLILTVFGIWGYSSWISAYPEHEYKQSTQFMCKIMDLPIPTFGLTANLYQSLSCTRFAPSKPTSPH